MQQHICPNCLLSIHDNREYCPHCGTQNPHYDPTATNENDGTQDSSAQPANHHPEATASKCAYCDSVLYSDEKTCSRCGAANPNFVVHGKSAGAGGTRSHGTENASTGKCPCCGGVLRSNERACPTCGSINTHYVLDTELLIRDPKTVSELQEYCAERNMPLLRMRFFIGEDTHEPQAFGIYRTENGNTVVYKNKSDGSRAVRYDGPDEAYAVSQLLSKLEEECRKRGIDPDRSLRAEAPSVSENRRAYRSRGTYPNNAATAKTVYYTHKSSCRFRKPILWLIVLIGVVAWLFFAVRYREQCTACMDGCAHFLFGDSPIENSSFGSFSDNNDSSYHSGYSPGGSSSYDSGNQFDNSWDSWDSSDTNWDSDW